MRAKGEEPAGQERRGVTGWDRGLSVFVCVSVGGGEWLLDGVGVGDVESVVQCLILRCQDRSAKDARAEREQLCGQQRGGGRELHSEWSMVRHSRRLVLFLSTRTISSFLNDSTGQTVPRPGGADWCAVLMDRSPIVDKRRAAPSHRST